MLKMLFGIIREPGVFVFCCEIFVESGKDAQGRLRWDNWIVQHGMEPNVAKYLTGWYRSFSLIWHA